MYFPKDIKTDWSVYSVGNHTAKTVEGILFQDILCTHTRTRASHVGREDLAYKCHQVRPCIPSRKSCPCRKRLLLFRRQFIALSYHMVSAAKVAQLLYWTPLEGNTFCCKSTLLCCLLFTPFDGMNLVSDQRISNAFAASSATSVQR